MPQALVHGKMLNWAATMAFLEPKESDSMNEPQPMGSQNANDGARARTGITRRTFLRYTGICAASLAMSAPLSCAFADDAMAAESDGRIVGWLHWDDDGDTATPFIFEPGFFESSLKYNAHLATFGCCIALAAVNAKPDGGDNHTYKDMQRNLFGLLTQIGIEAQGTVQKYSYEDYEYEDGGIDDSTTVKVRGRKSGNISWNDGFINKPTYNRNTTPKSTIGLCMGHRKMTLGKTEYNLVVLGVRGGNYEIEWCSNVTVGETGNHQGFQEAAEQAMHFLRANMREYNLTGPTKILICGQSRAGATTNLTAGNIVKYAIDHNPSAYATTTHGYNVSSFFNDGGCGITLNQSDLFAYGYNVPMGLFPETADEKAKAKSDYGNIYSIINPCDMVPKVAPAKWGFMRYGQDKLLPGPSNRSLYTNGREKMLDRLYALGLHRKSHFSYSIDTFPAIDFTFYDGMAGYFKEIQDTNTADLFIEKMINILATEVFHGRVKGEFDGHAFYGYAPRYESAMINAMDLYVNFLNDEDVTSEKDGKKPIDVFVSTAKNKLMDDMTSLARAVNAHNSIASVVVAYVTEAMKAAKLSDTETIDSRYGEKVRSILNSLLQSDYYVFAKGDQSSFSRFLSVYTAEAIAFGQKAGVVLSAHRSELCLAWLQSRDTYYYDYNNPRADISGAPSYDPILGAEVATQSASDGAALAGADAASLASVGAGDANGAADSDGAASTDESDELDEVCTYRKVIFDGFNSITYEVNGASYQIFKDGASVKDEDGDLIAVEGQACPFTYGVDINLQQVVYLPDVPNSVDGGTTYEFKATADAAANAKCAALRFNSTSNYPESLYIYEESPADYYGEPLEEFSFTVEVDRLHGLASSVSGNSFEGFSCDFDKDGVEWAAGPETIVDESDSDEGEADRYYYIKTATADGEMGGVNGGGMTLRGTRNLVLAIPNEGYEFDYWTLDDKWLVNGEETSGEIAYDCSTDEYGNLVFTKPESIPEAELIEGKQVEGEMQQGLHAYRALADDDHLVTAHFRAAEPKNNGASGEDAASDGSSAVEGVENGNGDASAKADGTSGTAAEGAGTKDNAKTAEKTGDATPIAAAAAVAAVAAAAAVGAGAKGSTVEE